MALENPTTAITADTSNIVDDTTIDAADVLVPLADIIAAVRAGYLKASSGSAQIGQLNDVLTVSAPLAKALGTPTDTLNLTIDVMTGATSEQAGAAGVVPQPQSGDQDKVLKGGGTWENESGGSAMTGATSMAAGTQGAVPQPQAGDQDKVLSGGAVWVVRAEVQPGLAGGRLSVSVDPIATGASATINYVPYKNNRLSLKIGGTTWTEYAFPNLSLNVSGLTQDKLYDVFVRDNSGTLELYINQWLTDSFRNVALQTVDGVKVLSSGADLYLGTIYPTGGSVIVDQNEVHVWNEHNQIRRDVFASVLSPNSWTYASAVWRPWNNDFAQSSVSFVQGRKKGLGFYFKVTGLPVGNYGRIGVGYDSATVNGAGISSGENGKTLSAELRSDPSEGLHTLYCLEYADAGGSNVTFNGYKGDGKQHLGGYGEVWA